MRREVCMQLENRGLCVCVPVGLAGLLLWSLSLLGPMRGKAPLVPAHDLNNNLRAQSAWRLKVPGSRAHGRCTVPAAAGKHAAATALPQAPTLRQAGMSQLTLRFADPLLESQFRQWHYSCLVRVSRGAVIVLCSACALNHQEDPEEGGGDFGAGSAYHAGLKLCVGLPCWAKAVCWLAMQAVVYMWHIHVAAQLWLWLRWCAPRAFTELCSSSIFARLGIGMVLLVYQCHNPAMPPQLIEDKCLWDAPCFCSWTLSR
jgi:hypothetical protein